MSQVRSSGFRNTSRVLAVSLNPVMTEMIRDLTTLIKSSM